TGRPKGCMLEHRGVVNRLAWMAAEYNLNDKDVILQKTTFTFDVSVWELLLPLCKGGQLVLCEKDDAGSPERLLSLIATHAVSCLHFVPSMLNTFLTALADVDDLAIRLKSLRMVITSGEALAPELVKEWYRRLSIPIHNLYGPTEASIDVTHYTTMAGDSNIPIGRPIWNTRMYILDFLHQLQPLGIPGEIAIGGIGLAKGYLNNELLTAEKFIPDPFVPGERIYLTGDLGRWRQDGNIEYLGRKDTQVKIRGFRIETGEIENALRAHPSVSGAAVITTSATGGEKELTAYVVSSEALSVAECRRHLAAILPEYMIPSHFVRLENLPLTTSGKLDRKKLPGARGSMVDTGVPYEAPRNPTEEILVSIWQDVLGRQRIGIKDDFFALGGHSLLAVKVVTMANKALSSPIAIRNLFTYPTIDQLSRYIVEPELFRKEESKLIDLASESHVDIDLDAIHYLARHALPPQKILLTGATGFVGAYIMAALLRATSTTLFCLVRAKGDKTAGQRIMANLEAYGLGDPAFESRIVPVRGDLADPGLGIDGARYDELAQTVDHIYHVAAHMDLQSSYSQLKPANVGSVIELIRLASTARLKKLIYASTLAIFSGGREGIRYEIDPIDDERHARAFGYSGSKWVAEKILLDTMARGLPAQVHRLGLI
ncbi:MAG TPA: AMP-binding protein, partial [Puia sp.]|nr:AMP-binding protein [Puia sp.]